MKTLVLKREVWAYFTRRLSLPVTRSGRGATRGEGQKSPFKKKGPGSQKESWRTLRTPTRQARGLQLRHEKIWSPPGSKEGPRNFRRGGRRKLRGPGAGVEILELIQKSQFRSVVRDFNT